MDREVLRAQMEEQQKHELSPDHHKEPPWQRALFTHSRCKSSCHQAQTPRTPRLPSSCAPAQLYFTSFTLHNGLEMWPSTTLPVPTSGCRQVSAAAKAQPGPLLLPGHRAGMAVCFSQRFPLPPNHVNTETARLLIAGQPHKHAAILLFICIWTSYAQ